MKKLLTACILLVVMMTASPDAQVLSSSWHPTHTVVVADTIAANQVAAYSATSSIITLLPKGYGWLYLYPTVYVHDRDTVITGDSLHFIVEVSPTTEVWTLFDTLSIVPASTNDSTVILAPRIKLDSANTTGMNYARVTVKWVFWLDDGDGGLIGETYDMYAEFMLTGRY